VTKPSITYQNGYEDDFCDGETDWTRVLSGMTAAQTYTNPQVNDGDVFELKGICDDAGQEYVYYEKDITNISSNTYDTAVVRWKTADSANGCGANVRLMFTSGDQFILGSIPQYSTSWTTTITAITSSKTIDKIRLYLDDYEDSVAGGSHYVYFDFILLCKRFTFPFVSGSEELEMDNNIIYLKAPGRVGNITQYMGADNPTIRFNGKIDDNATWTVASILAGDLFKLWWYMKDDMFHWLSTDLLGAVGGCKVTVPKLGLSKVSGSKSKRMWGLELRHYSKSDGDASSWGSLDWLGVKGT
jgi:hypothetical protein